VIRPHTVRAQPGKRWNVAAVRLVSGRRRPGGIRKFGPVAGQPPWAATVWR